MWNACSPDGATWPTCWTTTLPVALVVVMGSDPDLRWVHVRGRAEPVVAPDWTGLLPVQAVLSARHPAGLVKRRRSGHRHRPVPALASPGVGGARNRPAVGNQGGMTAGLERASNAMVRHTRARNRAWVKKSTCPWIIRRSGPPSSPGGRF